MSPRDLRRYRAERLLRGEFEGLRSKVLSAVERKLAAAGVQLDRSDIEACYAQAWQGLYAAILEGEDVENNVGWLVLVTYRRAIDEHRSSLRGGRDTEELSPSLEGFQRRDVAQELDDRTKLRQLFEAMKGKLSERECQAAALCYLQGLSRAQAARSMGISEKRMSKLMDGGRGGEPGVAAKVGALVSTIAQGGWCEQQGSLMRGYAFGILDPQGERYKLALAHRRECPSCRRYVASLRGLASVLPPVALPWRLAERVTAARARGDGGRARPRRPASGRRGVGPKISRGHALRLGPTLTGRPLSGKLLAGVALLALGTGGAALLEKPAHSKPPSSFGTPTGFEGLEAGAAAARGPLTGGYPFSFAYARAPARARHALARRTQPLSPQASATREFGPERHPAPSASRLAGVPHSPARGLPSPASSAAAETTAQRAEREFGLE